MFRSVQFHACIAGTADGSAMMRLAVAMKHIQRVHAKESEGATAVNEASGGTATGIDGNTAQGDPEQNVQDSAEGQGLEMIESAQALLFEVCITPVTVDV